MKTITACGLAATIIVLGVLIYTLWSALMYLSWFLVASGALWILISLWRHLMPAVESIVKARIEVSQVSHKERMELSGLVLQERVLAYAERYGLNVELAGNGTIAASHPPRAQQPPALLKEDIPQQTEQTIPTSVRYEDIRSYVPKDHVLIGVGEGGKIDTREKEIKGLIWIPGSSGAGKSNTTGLRVEEDYARGHKFMGIDPHFFKKDSLSNLVQPYMDAFIEKIAYTQEDILRILNFFIGEAEKRKAGSPCWPLTLLYDEIGSQVSDKPEEQIEKDIITQTKKAVRLAGQELRGFNMNLIAISQDAAGLAFLRKRALLVLGHKTVMMSERELICNGRGDLAREMDFWPVGRTVVYGVAVQGILIRQQPLLTVPIVSSTTLPEDGTGRYQEESREASGSEKTAEKDTDALVLKKFLNEAGKMRAQGESIDGILKKHGIAPGGRNNQNLKALLEQEGF